MHIVSGVIAKRSWLSALAASLDLPAPAPLAFDFGFLPIDEDNVGRIASVQSDKPIEGFEYLTSNVLGVFKLWSADSRLMYFETEYFGGSGVQSAVALDYPNVVFGPQTGNGPNGPVSQALVCLGVSAGPPHLDEFEAIGLGTHRSNDQWREAAGRH